MAISLVDSAFSELYHPPPVLLTVFFLCRVFIDFIGGLLVEDNVYCPSGSSLSALQWETQRHMQARIASDLVPHLKEPADNVCFMFFVLIFNRSMLQKQNIPINEPHYTFTKCQRYFAGTIYRCCFFFLQRVMPSYLTPLFNEIIFPIPVDLTGSISMYRIGILNKYTFSNLKYGS